MGGRAPPALVRHTELEGLWQARRVTRRHEKTKGGVRGEAVLKWQRAWQEAKATTAGRRASRPLPCALSRESRHAYPHVAKEDNTSLAP